MTVPILHNKSDGVTWATYGENNIEDDYTRMKNFSVLDPN